MVPVARSAERQLEGRILAPQRKPQISQLKIKYVSKLPNAEDSLLQHKNCFHFDHIPNCLSLWSIKCNFGILITAKLWHMELCISKPICGKPSWLTGSKAREPPVMSERRLVTYFKAAASLLLCLSVWFASRANRLFSLSFQKWIFPCACSPKKCTAHVVQNRNWSRVPSSCIFFVGCLSFFLPYPTHVIFGASILESHSRTERLFHLCRKLRAPQNLQ